MRGVQRSGGISPVAIGSSAAIRLYRMQFRFCPPAKQRASLRSGRKHPPAKQSLSASSGRIGEMDHSRNSANYAAARLLSMNCST